MTHAVESMFSVGKTPWHNLGTVLDSYIDKENILGTAGLDWTVREESMFISANGENVCIEDNKAIVRDTDNKILGVVGKRYEVVQNSEMMEFFSPFIESGEVKITTAGSLFGGQKVWMLGAIQRPNVEILPKDEIAQYLLFAHSHDGSLAVRVGFTPIRVVCANTLAQALSYAQSRILKVKHTKGVKVGIEAIKETINLASQKFETTIDQYRLLASKNVTKESLDKYVEKVFSTKETEEETTEDQEISTKKKNIMEKVKMHIETSPGSEIPGVRGTWWGAYNGVNYYLNHEIGRTDETRLDGIWFGQRKNQNQSALKLALEMAN